MVPADRGGYGDDELAMGAWRMLGWRTHGISVYCHLDNGQQSYAPANVLTLACLVAARLTGRSCDDVQRSRKPTPA
jgi:hypothetical protein